jgi:hypothetical protein
MHKGPQPGAFKIFGRALLTWFSGTLDRIWILSGQYLVLTGYGLKWIAFRGYWTL